MKVDSEHKRLLLTLVEQEGIGLELRSAAANDLFKGRYVDAELIAQLGKAFLLGWRIERERERQGSEES